MRKRMREPSCYSFISFFSKKLAWRAGSPPVAGERWYLRPPPGAANARALMSLVAPPPPPTPQFSPNETSIPVGTLAAEGVSLTDCYRLLGVINIHINIYAASSAQHVQQSWLIDFCGPHLLVFELQWVVCSDLKERHNLKQTIGIFTLQYFD